jgi:DNA replication protein DnaC
MAKQPTNQQVTSTPPTPTTGKPCSSLWPTSLEWTGPQVDLSWHPSLPQVVKHLSDWHKSTFGGLVLAGDRGCGKTTLTKIVLHAVGGPIPVIDWSSGRPESIRNAVFQAEPELLEDIRGSYSSGGEANIVSQCRRARLLILDDVGAAYVKEESQRWYEDILWRLLNERGQLKTLVTTNLTPPELKGRIGSRAWSRLQEILDSPDNYINMFEVPDYRARNW